GPALPWTRAGWTDAYFGISEAGAARSGLPRYRAGAGVTDVRINVHASYFLSAKAAITVNGAWGRLCNDAADSPIVTERGRPQQAFLGAMLTHRFESLQQARAAGLQRIRRALPGLRCADRTAWGCTATPGRVL